IGLPVSQTIRTAPSRNSGSYFLRTSDMTSPHSGTLHTLRGYPQGRRGALEFAHNQAAGEVQCWVDADDTIHPDAISECVRKLDDTHQLVYSYRQLIGPDNQNLGPDPKNRISYTPLKILVDNMIFHLRLFTTELFTVSGGVDNLESAIDWDMNLRMTEHTKPKCVPRILYNYRIHPNRMSNQPEQHHSGRTAVKQAIKRRNLNIKLITNNSGWHLQKHQPTPPTTPTLP
ncbi:MAG: glycosyltransferase, partial [Acidimicrobiales bacterium]